MTLRLSSACPDCQRDQCRVILSALRNHAGLRTRNCRTLIAETISELQFIIPEDANCFSPFWLRLSASLISFLHIVGSRICRFVGICPWHTHVAELFAVRICVIEERPSQLFPQRFYCPIFLMYFVLRAPPVFVISPFLTILPRAASMVVGLMSG